MFAKIILTSFSNLLDVISLNTRIVHHIRMQKYDSNCTSRSNWFHHAGIFCLVLEPTPLNTFESIEVLPAATFKEEPLKAYFWEQSTVLSPCKNYWTEAAREGGGLGINHPVFGPHRPRYSGAHSWFPCDSEEPCDCEGHNCAGTHSTIGHTAAAATTSKSLGIPLIFIVPPTPSPSEINPYNWHW